MKKILHLAVTGLLVFIGYISSLLTQKQRVAFGRQIGNFMCIIGKSRVNIALENLQNAFPDKTNDWRRDVMKKSFQNLGIVLVEVAAFKSFKEKDFRNLINYRNPDLLPEFVSRGKGLILMSGHFGNWELLAYSIGLFTGIPITIIVKSQKNKYADKILNSFRTMSNNKVVSMHHSARVIVKTLLNKGVVALLADQSASEDKDIFVEFFGRPAATFETPAVLSLKFKTPIMMGFPVRDNNGNYNVDIIEIKSDDLNYDKEGIKILTERHVKALENAIRANPDHWVWQHRRWKHSIVN